MKNVARTLMLLLAFASAALAAVALSGCGKKADPLPPIRLIPAQTTELVAIQRGGEILLRFPYPKTTEAGTPLSGISRVEVLQMTWEAPAGTGPIPALQQSQFDAAARAAMALEASDLPGAIDGDRVVVRLPMPGRRADVTREAVTLAVRNLAEGGEISRPSNLVTLEIQEPPMPPRGITAEPGPEGVRISWEYPEIEADEVVDEGSGIVGFNVYRRPASVRVYGEPVGTPGPAGRSYLDRAARIGERYIYTVTTADARRPVLVESAPSAEIEVDYQDRFPPPEPEGLVALSAGGPEGRVRLVWEASPATDVVGYRVYRRTPESTTFTRLTEEPLARPELTDTGLATGATYVYRVSAVDSAGNESGASEEVSVLVR